MWRYGIGRFVFLSSIFLIFGLLCLRPYTLSSMMITITTALMMISFPHAIMRIMPFAAMSLYTEVVGRMTHQYYNLPALPMHISDSINPSSSPRIPDWAGEPVIRRSFTHAVQV